jgi:TnpA family transposase
LACIYAQLKRCSSSEVAAMIEGVLRHCTSLESEQQYVDSHGQSEVAFAFCYLLGFDLLPRLKALAAQKLARPSPGPLDTYPHLQPILTRPINWELVQQQYDEMIKYTTALRLGTGNPKRSCAASRGTMSSIRRIEPSPNEGAPSRPSFCVAICMTQTCGERSTMA